MAEKIRVKIAIAERIIPLYVFPEEEEGLRKIARKIEATIKEFEKNYAVEDKRLALAMCTLQYATQLENNDKSVSLERDDLKDKLSALNTLIDQVF